MINARVGPLLKKLNIHQKKVLLLYEDILNIAREEVKFFADMYESEKEVYYIHIYIYILPAFVVNNPTCTKPCITLSIEMVSREGGL